MADVMGAYYEPYVTAPTYVPQMAADGRLVYVACDEFASFAQCISEPLPMAPHQMEEHMNEHAPRGWHEQPQPQQPPPPPPHLADHRYLPPAVSQPACPPGEQIQVLVHHPYTVIQPVARQMFVPSMEQQLAPSRHRQVVRRAPHAGQPGGAVSRSAQSNAAIAAACLQQIEASQRQRLEPVGAYPIGDGGYATAHPITTARVTAAVPIGHPDGASDVDGNASASEARPPIEHEQAVHGVTSGQKSSARALLAAYKVHIPDDLSELQPIPTRRTKSGWVGVYPARKGRWQAQVNHRSIGGYASAWEAGVAVAAHLVVMARAEEEAEASQETADELALAHSAVDGEQPPSEAMMPAGAASEAEYLTSRDEAPAPAEHLPSALAVVTGDDKPATVAPAEAEAAVNAPEAASPAGEAPRPPAGALEQLPPADEAAAFSPSTSAMEPTSTLALRAKQALEMGNQRRCVKSVYCVRGFRHPGLCRLEKGVTASASALLASTRTLKRQSPEGAGDLTPSKMFRPNAMCSASEQPPPPQALCSPLPGV